MKKKIVLGFIIFFLFIVGNGSILLLFAQPSLWVRWLLPKTSSTALEPDLEAEPDLKERRELIGTNFRVEYPDNWTINTEQRQHDIGRNVEFVTPGNNFVRLIVCKTSGLNSKEMTDDQIEAQLANFDNPLKSEFTSWGNYQGHGIELSDSVSPIKLTLRVFSWATKEIGFTVIELFANNDLLRVESGLRLIEWSFAIRKVNHD